MESNTLDNSVVCTIYIVLDAKIQDTMVPVMEASLIAIISTRQKGFLRH